AFGNSVSGTSVTRRKFAGIFNSLSNDFPQNQECRKWQWGILGNSHDASADFAFASLLESNSATGSARRRAESSARPFGGETAGLTSADLVGAEFHRRTAERWIQPGGGATVPAGFLLRFGRVQRPRASRGERGD